MKMYVSVNCKGELNPFMPFVAHKNKSVMEKFITKYNDAQCEKGATDTDDMAIVEEREIQDENAFITPSQYWSNK